MCSGEIIMKKEFITTIILSAILLFYSPIVFSASEDEKQHGDTTFEVGSWRMELIPDDQIYPIYVADPRRPRLHIGVGYMNTDIPDTTAGIVKLDAGARITLLKVQPGSKDANEFSLDIEGGLFTEFDLFNGLDNIGWDGRYGAYVAWNRSDLVVARVGFRHISSHLGDEYMENTGRTRINYTRDDLRVGIGYNFKNATLFYVEPSYAVHRGNEDRQEKWAIEGGIQYQGPYNIWKGSTGLYTGLHISSYQENGWNPSYCGQLGLKIKRDPRMTKLRVGFEGYVGRAVIGEYALDFDEAYLTLGLFIDF